jgi:rfaE bifunctional protein kinase chain/domain
MNPAEILDLVHRRSALVIGDICLDRWCTYDPATAEPSRETGIPRVGVVRTEVTPGAGGTVANNLIALGVGQVSVLGVIGDDGHGYELVRALGARGIDAGLCLKAPGVQTFTYTKLLNQDTGEEDMPRIDFIVAQPLAAEVEHRIVEALRDAGPKFDAILVSDQAETEHGGVVTPAVRAALADLKRAAPEMVIWVDSRMRIENFRGACLKPNNHEAEAASQRLFGEVDYQKLRAHGETDLLMVTHGGDGVLIVEPGGQKWVHTERVENPVDICGAGDSFSAGAAMAYAATRRAADAARFGNLVASITIMKKGTGTASPQEVMAAWARQTREPATA